MPPSVRSVCHLLPHSHRLFTTSGPSRSFFKWLQPRNGPVDDYPTLVSSQKRHPWLAPELDHAALTRLMAARLAADEPATVLQVFSDLGPVWGCKANPADIRLYLRACGRTGSVAEAIDWLRNSGDMTDSSRSELLAGCVRFRDALEAIKQTQVQNKSEADYAHLLRLATAENLTEERSHLMEELAREGLHEGLSIHAAQLSQPRSLAFVRARLEEGVELEEWIEVGLVAHLSHAADDSTLFDVIAQLFDPARSRDALRTTTLLATLIRGIKPPSNMDEAQRLADRILDLTGTDILQEPKLSGCLFEQMQIASHFECVTEWCQLINARNGPLLPRYIEAMLKFHSSVLSQPGLLRKLWDDFCACEGVTQSEQYGLATAFLRLSLQANDYELFTTMLEEVSRRKLELKASVLEELVEPLISLAPSRSVAYAAYEQLIRLGYPTRPFFDRFLLFYLARCESLSVKDGTGEKPQALSMHALSAMFDQMRAADVPPDAETYVRLLDHFTRVVKANPRNQSTRLQLERLYTLLKLDAYVEPDARLLHYFLKGFAYNGMYSHAWAVWNQLSGEDRFRVGMSNASVATMLDLAGFESEAVGDGRLNVRALEAWKRLREASVKEWWPRCELNKNLWDSWVECLCRARHLGPATKVVLEEMPKYGSGPDHRTCSILLRFCRKESERRRTENWPANGEDPFDEARRRIQVELPEIWSQVCHEGLTPTEIERGDKLLETG